MRDVWRRRQTKGLKQMFSTSERHLPRTSNKDIRSEAMMNRAKIGKDHPITLAIISKMLELEQKIVHRKFSKENFEQLLKLYSVNNIQLIRQFYLKIFFGVISDFF